MKAITTLLTTSLFAAGAYAGSGNMDIYHGFAEGNSDLSQWGQPADEGKTGIQPAIGDAPYGFRGRQDSGLFKSPPSRTPTPNRIDVYGDFANSELPSSF